MDPKEGTGPVLGEQAPVSGTDRRTQSRVLPELVPAHWWEQPLHTQTALRLKAALLFRPGTVVISVPYHLERQHLNASAEGFDLTNS